MRSKWKGNFIILKIYKLSLPYYNYIYKNFENNCFKLYNRNLFIFSFLSKLNIYIYNGKSWLFIYIKIRQHIGKKFGEFFFTKKRSIYLSKRKLKKRKKKKRKK